MPTPQVLDELLHQLRPRVCQGADLDPQTLIDWLGRQLDAEIALVDRAGKVEVSTARLTPDILASLQPVLTQLSRGQLAAAASQVGGFHVRCEALGRPVPRPVLVVGSPSPLTRESLTLASHVGAVVEVLRQAQQADDLALRYQQAATRLRLAVFTALMAGEVTLARRMTAGAVPPLLDAERLRIHLLRCPPSDRGRLIDAYQDASGYHGRGLMVRCPVYDHHLICLLPVDHDGDSVDGGLAAPLRALVRDNPNYALGISAPVPLQATARAYDQARHALAIACHTFERVADYHGRPPLAGLLPRRQALAWAHAFLEPIRDAPRLTLDITSLALNFPRSGVARLLDISRNTVTAHLTRVQDALYLDLQDPHSRAELALALAINDLLVPDGNAAAEHVRTPSADSLLSTEAALTWAHAFLQPLQPGTHRTVHQTLRAWIEAGTDAQRTAHNLGISRTTVRAHLRTAEQLLKRSLQSPGPGTHELIHAFRIADRAP
ncbi:helix-turn-helix domain-containing protein [Streptomyces sp. ME02-8801-2C]|uniref:helix-turn-helix domain-containing protein n=1 Tax=Streptomyces sp. ME02-8801-2C TaxID=3028680 RepID=UPI0029AA0FC3|nr:helix-turn-helix domain-containing protein [Streptomyces sp. ME02-8801-2C]MDX3458779.1 helix-turn-helix domain-containing protein [Streptomyces sp. ME02-8801-2C]